MIWNASFNRDSCQRNVDLFLAKWVIVSIQEFRMNLLDIGLNVLFNERNANIFKGLMDGVLRRLQWYGSVATGHVNTKKYPIIP